MSAALVRLIEWKSLALEPGSFVKRDLKRLESDLLFSVQWRRQLLYLYLLLEHQSTVDHDMPLRFLGYMVEIWRRHREQHPSGPLPVVIPFVLHQGPARWTVSTQFSDLFGDANDEETAADLTEVLPYLPKFEHCLLDLSQAHPETEMQDMTLKATLLLMQYARRAVGLEQVFQWIDTNYADIDPDQFRDLLVYAWNVDNDLDVEKLLRDTLTHQDLRTTAMTVAAKLIAQGEARGETRGETRGKAAGRLVGSITTLEGVLKLPQTSLEILESMSLTDLDAKLQALQQQFQSRTPETR